MATETLYFSDIIEEPLMVIQGEGSGEDSNVGNEEERKKKIFFFGQPGCLKHSPIKTVGTENHNNHSKADESSGSVSGTTEQALNKAEILAPNDIEKTKETDKTDSDDDENGDALLQKISEALGDETEKEKSPKVVEELEVTNLSTDADETPIGQQEDHKKNEKISRGELKVISETNNSEIINDLQPNDDAKLQEDAPENVIGENSNTNNNLEFVETDDKEKTNDEQSETQVEEIPTNKLSLTVQKSHEESSRLLEEKSKPHFSIVPYDEDSTSSSSHLDAEKDEEVKIKENIVEIPQDKSASLPSEQVEAIGFPKTDETIATFEGDPKSEENVEKCNNTPKSALMETIKIPEQEKEIEALREIPAEIPCEIEVCGKNEVSKQDIVTEHEDEKGLKEEVTESSEMKTIKDQEKDLKTGKTESSEIEAEECQGKSEAISVDSLNNPESTEAIASVIGDSRIELRKPSEPAQSLPTESKDCEPNPESFRETLAETPPEIERCGEIEKAEQKNKTEHELEKGPKKEAVDISEREEVKDLEKDLHEETSKIEESGEESEAISVDTSNNPESSEAIVSVIDDLATEVREPTETKQSSPSELEGCDSNDESDKEEEIIIENKEDQELVIEHFDSVSELEPEVVEDTPVLNFHRSTETKFEENNKNELPVNLTRDECNPNVKFSLQPEVVETVALVETPKKFPEDDENISSEANEDGKITENVEKLLTNQENCIVSDTLGREISAPSSPVECESVSDISIHVEPESSEEKETFRTEEIEDVQEQENELCESLEPTRESENENKPPNISAINESSAIIKMTTAEIFEDSKEKSEPPVLSEDTSQVDDTININSNEEKSILEDALETDITSQTSLVAENPSTTNLPEENEPESCSNTRVADSEDEKEHINPVSQDEDKDESENLQETCENEKLLQSVETNKVTAIHTATTNLDKEDLMTAIDASSILTTQNQESSFDEEPIPIMEEEIKELEPVENTVIDLSSNKANSETVTAETFEHSKQIVEVTQSASKENDSEKRSNENHEKPIEQDVDDEDDDVSSPEDFGGFPEEGVSEGEDSDDEKHMQAIASHTKSDVTEEIGDIEATDSCFQDLLTKGESESKTNKKNQTTETLKLNTKNEVYAHENVDSVQKTPVEEQIIASYSTQNQSFVEKRNESPVMESKIEIQVENVKTDEKLPKDQQKFTKPSVSRKRKMSERKSVSESDSEGNNVTDTISNENTSEDEEVVLKKKPRMRGKTSSPKKAPITRKATTIKKTVKVDEIISEPVEESAEKVVDNETTISKEITESTAASIEKTKDSEKTETKQTLQNIQFDFDGSEDIAANVAAIKTMICKDAPKKESDSENSDDEVSGRKANKRSRKSQRDRFSKRGTAESSSDEDCTKKSSKNESKRSKTVEEPSDKSSPSKKKRETGAKGLLKYIDTSLVIETNENEAPVRQSRRIAQQKIREETERRQMEEKMLKQMKAEAEKKKKGPDDVSEEENEDEDEDEQKDSTDDESFKESRKKKKSKILAADKQWQTSSSHSEHSESEDYLEHIPSDPGSPLFKSDHEFSPESDVDDTTQVQPVKRARTAKKLVTVSSSDEDEDINPKHACQVCHKTDSPEWILLCDECDCGYHCSCLKPIIFLIPSGNWFCPLCCHKKLINNLSDQLSQLDTLIYNVETAELRKQRQKLAEISEQNIIQERRKNREKETESRESTPESKGKSSGSTDSDSDAPLKDYFYKLRKRNQTAAPSYRFNEYDDLINSAIRHEMDEVKGAGNLGRGKDISTIIEADNEDKKQSNEIEDGDDEKPAAEKNDDAESSGSDIIRPKKLTKRKKKSRKLNNLDVSSEEEQASDEDFKGSVASSDSEVDEEDLSMSSVSESSLDMPSKKNKGRNMRSSTRTREKRVDRRFINDNSSDDEPLIKAKRLRKKNDSDEEEFDINDDEDDEGSVDEEIDSEDLCDDTETDSSSQGNWPKKKKKRNASYDIKPRKNPKKKDDNEDRAFRAGISKKKALKKSDNESEASASDVEKGRRKTRGKKLLYLIEDDLDSDESDGIKPGVKRPETPPEEREMFVKKQEEIKRMLAAKDTEAAKKLAAPTIEPIHIAMEKPKSPSLPFSNEPASLSTIPKNVIESAKALDTDYNRIKPIAFGSIHGRGSDGNIQTNDMSEEDLAKMMEEEDFAQHQLKLAGEAIARSKKLLELEAKEEEFAAFTKANREKEWQPVESKKRSRKSKSSEKSSEEFPNFSKALPPMPQAIPTNFTALPMPPLINSNMTQLPPKPHMQHPPSIIANLMQQQHSFLPTTTSLSNDRPSVLSSFMTRPDMHHQQLKIHQPIPPEVFNSKILPFTPSQQFEEEEKKKGRRKKFTPLRTDLPEGNISKLAKLDPPSVIQSVLSSPPERIEDKNKVPRSDLPKLAVAAPPQIFNPATNPTPSVITRLLQPHQQRPGLGPFPQGFTEVTQASSDSPNIRMFAAQEELKNASPNKVRGPMPQPPVGSIPQSSFGENPFVPRNIHPLYRGPTPYGMPPHARLPPYPFHHLHPNLRPEYSAPYNIPPQFSYYAPPAHSRQPPQASAIPLNHGASQHVAGNEDISNSIRNANNSEEPSETSEFGGLVSYFSSQQELD